MAAIEFPLSGVALTCLRMPNGQIEFSAAKTMKIWTRFWRIRKKGIDNIGVPFIIDRFIAQLSLSTHDSLKLYQNATNQLTAFNDFSTARFTQVQKHLETHTKLIKEIKGDLDAAFRKIR